MQTKHLDIILIVFLMMFSGCKTIHKVSTTIHPDGSCTRTIMFETSDSTEIHYGNFHLPLDSTWKIHEIVKEDTLYATTKNFKSVSDLNLLYQTNKEPFRSPFCEIGFKKHFRWFYTFYDYRETYKSINQYNLIPISDYLTQEEIELLFSDEDSLQTISDRLKIEEKFGVWFERTLFEEYFHALERGIVKLNHPELSWETFAPLKDSLLNHHQLPVNNGFDVDIEEYIQNSFTALQSYLPQNTLKLLKQHEASIFEEFIGKSKLEIGFDDINEVNEVTMPGLILDTNAESVQGNRVLWKTDIENFYFHDYEMWVESRKVNLWALLLTIVLLLMIFTALILGTIKRK